MIIYLCILYTCYAVDMKHFGIEIEFNWHKVCNYHYIEMDLKVWYIEMDIIVWYIDPFMVLTRLILWLHTNVV